MADGPKRRLPVLQSSSRAGDEDAEPPRPAWQWILFDVLITLAVWVGLAAPATFFRQHVIDRYGAITPPTDLSFLVMTTGPHVLALGIAAGFGGYLLGRFGGPTAARREALIAAGIVAGLADLIALPLGVAVMAVLTVLILGSATFGVLRGIKKRSPNG